MIIYWVVKRVGLVKVHWRFYSCVSDVTGNRVIIVDADDQKSVLTWYTIVLKIFPIFRLLAQQATSSHAKEHEKFMTLSSQTVLAATVQKCVVG